MAIKRPEKQEKVTYEVKVIKAREVKWGISFDMEVNGVAIYGCTHREGTKDGKAWSMVTFPSYKGKDENWYNHAWFPVSNELKEDIETQISNMLMGK